MNILVQLGAFYNIIDINKFPQYARDQYQQDDLKLIWQLAMFHMKRISILNFLKKKVQDSPLF